MAWSKDNSVAAKLAAAEALAQAQRAELAAESVDDAIAEVDVVVAENTTRFLNAVATVALRDSTYPTPLNGDTVRVTGTSTTYRYSTGSGWVVTDVYNATAIDNVTAQLADKAGYTYVNDEINKKANGSPKGVYTTVANLQTAHPTGDTNNYIVVGNVAEVASLNVTASPTATGNVTVTLNGVATNVAVTAGVAEVASLNVSAIPTAAGNVTVTLNGVTSTIAVDPTVETTTNLVSAKIRGTAFAGWTTGGTGSTVTFTATVVGTKTDATYSAGTTGATGAMTTPTQGVNADTSTTVATKIRNTAFTGWTTGGSATTITFTSTTTGVKTDSIYSAGSTGTTGSMSTTIQGVDPDGKWYYWNGSAWTNGGQYQSTGIAQDSITKEMMQLKFNGINDVSFASDSMVMESLTEVSRPHNINIPFPTTIGITDVFVKIKIPATVSAAGSFLLINNSYSFPISASTVTAPNLTVDYHTAGGTGDVVPLGNTYYLRLFNDGAKTTIIVYAIDGDIVGSLEYAETITLTSIRPLTGIGILCYDIVVFDGLLSEELMNDYFFGIERVLYVDGFNYDQKDFQLKAFATNTFLADGKTVQEEVTTLRQLTAKSKLAGKLLACFGDSLTGNYDPPVDYPSFISDFTGMNVLNVGVGGTRMAYDGTYTNYDPFCMVKITDALISGDWSTQDAAYPNLTLQGKQQADNLKILDLLTTDYITMFYGANDYTGTLGIENSGNDMDIRYFGGAYRYVLDKLLTNFPHLKIMLITPIYRDRLNIGDGINSDDQPYRGNYMVDFSNKTQEVGKKFHLPVLNLHDNSGINKYTADIYLEDGLHPTLAARKDVLGSKISAGLINYW